MTAEYLCDTLENVPVENLEGLAINRDLFSMELGAERW